MFQCRKYDLNSLKIRWHKNGYICEVVIGRNEISNVMCLILMNEKRICNSDYLTFEDDKLENTSPTKRNFISTIITHAKFLKNNIKQIILISESIPLQALQEMLRSPIQMVHFSFEEMSSKKISQNIYQPINIKRLDIEDAKNFKKENPLFKQELQRFGIFDKLVKYLGFEVGDIITFVEHDKDTGYVPEFGIVVQDL